MIRVTRLKGAEIYLNPDLLVSVEEKPDTVVTLSNGEKLIIQEPAAEVVSRFVAYKRAIHTALSETAPLS